MRSKALKADKPIPHKKKTAQGMGTHSKPNHGRKKRRGQGK